MWWVIAVQCVAVAVAKNGLVALQIWQRRFLRQISLANRLLFRPQILLVYCRRGACLARNMPRVLPCWLLRQWCKFVPIAAILKVGFVLMHACPDT